MLVNEFGKFIAQTRYENLPADVIEIVKLRVLDLLAAGATHDEILTDYPYLEPDDITAVALPVLRHRLLVNFRAEADGISADPGRSA